MKDDVLHGANDLDVMRERHSRRLMPAIFKSTVSRLFHRKIVALGALVLVFIMFSALTAGLVSPYDPKDLNVYVRLQAPSLAYPFGTDHLGRDILSRVIYGARVSLIVGFASALFSTLIGVFFGLIAGYYRSVDRILMRVMDGLLAFPVILLAIALMAALGPKLINVVIALTLVYAPRTARLVRGVVLTIKESVYIEAVAALGAGSHKIMREHILPNSLSPIIVQATFTFAYAVQVEAALSFLGAGVPPQIPSWGVMLAESRVYMVQAPWTALMPGAAIAMTVLALNSIGDGLRDTLDPHFKDS